MTIRVAEHIHWRVYQLLQNTLPPPEILVPDDLQPVLETTEDLSYLESLPPNIIERVLGTHKPQRAASAAWACSVSPGPDDAPANHKLKLAPLGLAIELHELEDILTEQQLALIKVAKAIILLVEVLKDHTKEQIGAYVAMVSFGVASNFEKAFE